MLKFILVILIQIICSFEIYTWPGDQDSLTCIKIFGTKPEITKAKKDTYKQ